MFPLTDLRVIDFSTLLPGPMCSLLLAQAGAEVIKIERPGRGDEMRSYLPRFANDSANHALLNQNKRSIALDLKDPTAVRSVIDLIRTADVVIDQFRPGVMDRLGLGFRTLQAVNPRLIYCAITGWGQDGPLAEVAAHDLNYQAESGLLGLTAGADGSPVLPGVLVADLAGGAYPAFMNILLALRARDRDGVGRYLDVAMADNLFPLMYWALGEGFAAGHWPAACSGLVVGGTPRYQIYRTSDERFLAAAPLEQKFWENFLRVIEAPHLLDDSNDPVATRGAVAAIISGRSADAWMLRFTGVDACVCIVRTLAEAVTSPHFRARGVFDGSLQSSGAGTAATIPALPLPIVAGLRRTDGTAPALGEGNATLLPPHD